MNIAIAPRLLRGSVTSPPSKSDAHRLLIASALADRPAGVHLTAVNDDMRATVRCLEALGARIASEGDTVQIAPMADFNENACCDCGESGSTLRFLTPVAAALRGAEMTGCGRLGKRPMEPLLSLLCAHGCTVLGKGLPFRISGGLQSGLYALRGDISSQFITGLLFALPLLSGDSRILLTAPLQSRGYVDMTLRVLARFGIIVRKTDDGFFIPGGQRYTLPFGRLEPEGDWSGAAFWYGANYLGSDVQVGGLCADSAQGDSRIVQLSQALPDEIDVGDIPDLLPVLSIMACKKQGKTQFVNAARLRMKESDRLEAGKKMILSLGGSAEINGDSMTVHGTGRLTGGSVDGMGDHRIVMSAAIAACICENEVIISGAEAVKKSYPAFFDDFQQLGGKLHVL